MTKQEFIERINNLGWGFKESEDCCNISNYSQAGEELNIEAEDFESLVYAIKEEYYNYDVDEHFDMWYRANRGEPSSVRALLEDCEYIDQMLEEISNIALIYISEIED